MSLAKRIVRNTAWLYGAELVCKALQIFLVIVLARHYGVELFGQYSFAITFTLLFSMFADMGMNSLVIREVAKDRKSTSRYLTNVLFIKAVLAIVSLTIIFILINVLGYPSEVKMLVYSFGFYNVIIQVIEFVKAFFKAHELMFLDSVVKVFEKVFTVGLSLVLVFLDYPLRFISYAFVLSAALTLVFGLILVRKKISAVGGRISKSFIRKFLRMSAPFALSLLLYTAYLRIDILFINKMQGNAPTGIYTASMQLVESLLFISVFFGLSVFPLLTKFYHENNARFWRIYGKVLKVLLIAGLPIVAGTVFLGDRFMTLFFGSEYVAGGIVLKLLVFFMMLNFLASFHDTVLISMDRERRLIRLLGVLFVSNVLITYFLVAHYSIIGAAIAKILSDIIHLGGALYLVRPQIGKEAVSVLFKSAAIFFMLLLLMHLVEGLNLLLIIVVVASCYAVLLVLLKVVSKEDFLLMKEALKS